MDLKEAIKLLDYHQRWRLGIEDDMKYTPRQLTDALDVVLSEVKKNNIEDVCNQRELLIDFMEWTNLNINSDGILENEIDDFIKQRN